MVLNGSQILTRVLMEQGVDTVFGYPGGAVLNIYDALYAVRDRLRHVMTAHEQGAAHAADGYARATGKTGVVLATSGPGATNLITGLATAYMDSVPVVAITGNVGTSLIGRDSFQEVYIAGIAMPITKHTFAVQRVEELAGIVRRAFQIAQSGRKGPVLIDIPKDVTAAQCDYEPSEPLPLEPRRKPQADKVAEAAKLINEAQQPVVFFGGGVVASEAGDELRHLIERADIPATYTLMAAGVLGYGDPMNLGLLGMHGSCTANYAVDNADLVIAVGTRFSDRVALNPETFAKRAKIVQIDIDPSEVNKNVLVDCALVSDVEEGLRALLPLIEKASHSEWRAKILAWQKKDYHPKDDDSVLKPHQVMGAICDAVGEDAVFATDVGQHQLWAAQYVRLTHPRSFLTSGGLGTMGFGYGAAIGAQVACPDRTVVHITGDGSFHMNLQEGCTAVSYDLPVITVIMNNQVLGMVRQWQTTFYGKRYSSTDPHRKTDFVKLAEGFGAKGRRCENLAEFREAMAWAKAQNGPVWIDCAIAKDEKVLPMIPAGGSVSDIIMD